MCGGAGNGQGREQVRGNKENEIQRGKMEKYSRREKLRLEVSDKTEEREHFQQDIELIYVLEGELDIQVGNQLTHMKPDDFLLINMGKKYTFKATDNILYARLSIQYNIFRDGLGNRNIMFWCDSTGKQTQKHDDFRRLLKQLLKHYMVKSENIANFGYISLCYQLMEELSVNFLVNSAEGEAGDESDKFKERNLQIESYIYSNYDQKISIKDLSEKLFLSVGYLTRFFKKNYGMSFTDYLTHIRLVHAMDEIWYTDHPITKIAYENGFSNAAAFDKAFKKEYGKAPSVIRRKQKDLKNDRADETKSIKERLEELLWEEQKENGSEEDKRNISGAVSAKESQVMTPYWKKLINIGTASELLKSEVREHIILLKSALDFEYMRFWSPFTKELLIDINNAESEYNFSKLDSILDFLVQQEIKPHIELMNKPYRVQKNNREALVYEMENPVDSITKWDDLMNSFMKHIIHRYSKKEVDNWKFELWYEESYLSGSEDMDWYFKLFNHTYRIVKSYSAVLEVGGCSMQTFGRGDSYRGFMNEFLKRWSKEENKPDFMSVMSYSYIMEKTKNGWGSQRSTDSSFILHSIEQIKEEFANYGFGDKKLYIVEWNQTISERNYINDTCYKGAYIIKNYIELYGKADEMAYFQGSDRPSEYYDTNVLLYGGTGIISRDGILKPAAFAFDFLNRSFGTYLGKGSHYFISSDGNHTYGIVCHNCKELNYNYYYTDEDRLEKEHISKYFEDKDRLDLHLRIDDVKNGIYQMKIYRINEQNGSALELWREMEYEKELSKKDVKYFSRLCEPKLSIHKCEAADGSVKVELQLAANEIAFVKLTLRE